MWRRILICRFIYRFSMDCTFPSLSKFAPLVIIYSKRPASENLHLFPFFSFLSSNNMNDRVFCRVLEPPQIIDSNQMIVGPSKRPFKIWRETRKAWENISLSSPLLRSVHTSWPRVRPSTQSISILFVGKNIYLFTRSPRRTANKSLAWLFHE